MHFRLRYVALALLVLAAPMYGTTAIEMSTADLAREADLIVVGSVTGVASRWADQRNLVTDVTVAVSEVLKGEASGSIVVTLPGGVDANRRIPIAMSYPAAPQLSQGEKTFLFLVRDDEGLIVAGWSQGKYSIVADAAQEYVTRDLTQLRLTSGVGVVEDGAASREPLADFKRQVTAALAGN